MNGEDRRRRVAFLLLALAAVMAVASAAFAVEISLSSSDIARIGATPQVQVHCPAAGNPCKIDKVYWVLSFPPPRVTAVKIYWTPAATGTYDVYVVLYDNNGNMISNGYGSTSEDITSTDPTTTTVNLASPVNPALIKYVEIAIVEHVET